MFDIDSNWAIVELMGHKVVAGRVSKSEELGAALLRVDVPATSAYPEFTQQFGVSAIYCVTYVSEEVARRTAEANKTNPVSVYVPDLITKEQLAETVKNYEERLARMRALPATVNREEFLRERQGSWDGPDRDGDDDDPDGHSLNCTCETCIQNYPERMLLSDEDEDDNPGSSPED